MRGARCRFQNINYRVNTQFVLFTGGVNTNTLQTPNYNIIAQSPIITNAAPNQPVQASTPYRRTAARLRLCTSLSFTILDALVLHMV